MSGSVEGQSRPVIVWFRDDLRLADNPALTAAASSGRPLLAVYVLDEGGDRRPLGSAARWWLHQSLTALSADLARHGVPLLLRRGPVERVVPAVVAAAGAEAVHWNRRYDAPERAVDAAIKADLKTRGIHVESHNGHLLVEPWTVKPKSGDWFKVFTPFWKTARLTLDALPPPAPVPSGMVGAAPVPDGDQLDDWGLLPTRPDWAGGLRETWTPGEAGARARLAGFLDDRLRRYAAERDHPGADATSRLSPHLRFGEISPTTIWHAALHHAETENVPDAVVSKFLAEIGWREFSYHLLYHFPELARRNFQPRFDDFPWRAPEPGVIAAWQRGRTGYPIVDAGMRELWATGVMHNRVRMVVASFLVKHLMIDWRVGEAWFWDTLCDADIANNPASWQWVAGSGADAAPYFRVFNPMLQGEKFDGGGDYVRRWVPELSRLPDGLLHQPWTASHETLRNFGVSLGRTYPEPIVDHSAARDRALEAFARIKTEAA